MLRIYEITKNLESQKSSCLRQAKSRNLKILARDLPLALFPNLMFWKFLMYLLIKIIEAVCSIKGILILQGHF